MIQPGDRLENPVTSEVLVFHRTSAQTGGESVLVETIVRPQGFVAAAHVHPTRQSASRSSKARSASGSESRSSSPGPATSQSFRRARLIASGTQARNKRA